MISVHITKTNSYYYDNLYNFAEIFNRHTGFYYRSDVLNTSDDPFMRSFPSLLDIGIMGGCKSCNVCKADCYQGGKPYNPDNDMTLADYKKLIDEGKEKGLMQVALGGAGNPNDHLSFKEILEYTRVNEIIPNYTTSGIGLTDTAVQLTKQYCGAVAVSWYYQKFTMEAVDKFVNAGVKTSLHFVLSKSSIHDAINLLKTNQLKYDTNKIFDLSKSNINAVIFLLYKPVGLGSYNKVLNPIKDREVLQEFFYLLSEKQYPFKIGFDSCTVPAIVNFSTRISKSSIDTCEGGRFSAYINPQLVMTPCSFDQSLTYGVQLSDDVSIEDAWNSEKFSMFRQSLQLSCTSCRHYVDCRGGCPLMKSIVLCPDLNNEAM